MMSPMQVAKVAMEMQELVEPIVLLEVVVVLLAFLLPVVLVAMPL